MDSKFADALAVSVVYRALGFSGLNFPPTAGSVIEELSLIRLLIALWEKPVVAVHTIAGPTFLADEAINRIVGPSPINPYTYIHGPGGAAAIEVLEDPSLILPQLQLTVPLAVLHRPDGVAVWMKAIMCTLARPLTAFEHAGFKPPFSASAIVICAGHAQPVQESPAQCQAILNALGAHL